MVRLNVSLHSKQDLPFRNRHNDIGVVERVDGILYVASGSVGEILPRLNKTLEFGNEN